MITYSNKIRKLASQEYDGCYAEIVRNWILREKNFSKFSFKNDLQQNNRKGEFLTMLETERVEEIDM